MSTSNMEFITYYSQPPTPTRKRLRDEEQQAYVPRKRPQCWQDDSQFSMMPTNMYYAPPIPKVKHFSFAKSESFYRAFYIPAPDPLSTVPLNDTLYEMFKSSPDMRSILTSSPALSYARRRLASTGSSVLIDHVLSCIGMYVERYLPTTPVFTKELRRLHAIPESEKLMLTFGVDCVVDGILLDDQHMISGTVDRTIAFVSEKHMNLLQQGVLPQQISTVLVTSITRSNGRSFGTEATDAEVMMQAYAACIASRKYSAVNILTDGLNWQFFIIQIQHGARFRSMSSKIFSLESEDGIIAALLCLAFVVPPEELVRRMQLPHVEDLSLGPRPDLSILILSSSTPTVYAPHLLTSPLIRAYSPPKDLTATSFTEEEEEYFPPYAASSSSDSTTSPQETVEQYDYKPTPAQYPYPADTLVAHNALPWMSLRQHYQAPKSWIPERTTSKPRTLDE